ncbi:MAG: hypothetical protein H0S79_05450 [Anaerolineaceae bacterium]|nr:hypothetical protein [Anaerolineaceae bacterium]
MFPLEESVIAWLLNSDASIRWQVMRDLIDAHEPEVLKERTKVATEGWGAKLLSMQGEDGAWGGVAWNHGWDSTMHALLLLRDIGLDPECREAQHAVNLVNQRVTWRGCGPQECDQNSFFEGEIEPCINGQVSASGAYFGQNVKGIITRLLGEQLTDGGWNCDAPEFSTRSSFNTTICVLEALLAFERKWGSVSEVTSSRLRGQEYLLQRHLHRQRSTMAPITRDRKSGGAWDQFAFPTWWHYDILRGLDYLRAAGVVPDERLNEAIDLVISKRGSDGRWVLNVEYPGKKLLDLDNGVGFPSRWITLRAYRVLKWYLVKK